MALSNAERQARYRARLKARANGEGMMDHVDKAVEEAVDALWSFFNRPGPDGEPWADIDGCACAADYRKTITGQMVETCRALLWNGEGLLPEEKQALTRIVQIADRVDLRPVKA